LDNLFYCKLFGVRSIKITRNSLIWNSFSSSQSETFEMGEEEGNNIYMYPNSPPAHLFTSPKLKDYTGIHHLFKIDPIILEFS